MKGASASFSFPRSGSRGFKGSFSRTWLTPADAAAATKRKARTAAPAARAARRLRRTGGFPCRAGVGGVELGEPRVVAADVGIVRAEIERLLVFHKSPRELARGLERDGEVVVGARVARLLRDGLLEPERGFAPEPLARHLGAECDLGFGPIGLGVGGAGREHKAARCDNDE